MKTSINEIHVLTIIIMVLLAENLNVVAQTWEWSGDQLTYAREGLSATVLDDSIFYSGGRVGEYYFINYIEIYDVSDDLWNVVYLDTPERMFSSTVTAGGKVFIAGGARLPVCSYYDEVDIYNKETDEWTVEYLSEARTFIGAATDGNKVFFAGGAIGTATSVNYFDVIDIYDTDSGIWSEEELSVPRCLVGATTGGGKVFFAGGITGDNEVTDLVDIYDINSGEWTIEYLSEPRAAIAAVAYGDKVYFAGGALPNAISSDKVDVYNIEDEDWEDVQILSEPRIVTALNINDALIFTGHVDYLIIETWVWGYPNGVVDIYYPETDQWDFSAPELTPSKMWHAFASYNNNAYYAGGWDGEITNSINILEYGTTGIWNMNNDGIEFEVCLYPNPFTSSIRINYNLKYPVDVNVTLFGNNGIQIEAILNKLQKPGNQEIVLNTKKLPSGIYYCLMQTNKESQMIKMIKL